MRPGDLHLEPAVMKRGAGIAQQLDVFEPSAVTRSAWLTDGSSCIAM
jgi:hypothetical protein